MPASILNAPHFRTEEAAYEQVEAALWIVSLGVV